MIKDLLNNLETRNSIKNAIDQAVSVKHSQEQCKEDLKEISEMIKDKYDIKPSQFNQFVEAVFNAEKIEAQHQRLTDVLEAVDTMYK